MATLLFRYVSRCMIASAVFEVQGYYLLNGYGVV